MLNKFSENSHAIAMLLPQGHRECQNKTLFIIPSRAFITKFTQLAKHSRRVLRLYGCGRTWGCTSLRQKKPRGCCRGAYLTRTLFRVLVQKSWCRGETTRTDIACQLSSNLIPCGSFLS